MSIIATIIGEVILLLRKTVIKTISPKFNCAIWLVFIAILVFPVSMPSKVSVYNFIELEEIKNEEKAQSISKFFNSEENINNVIKNSNKLLAKHFKTILAYIWFGVVLFKLAVTLISHRAFLKRIGDDEVTDERIIKILERCKKKLKIKRNIKIIKQDHVVQPAIFGVLNVRILFTEVILNLDNIYINNIIMHELSHYKRKDNILNALIPVLKAIYWFNPFFNIIFKRIRQDMELTTDEMAIKNMNKEQTNMYSKIIIETSRLISYGPQLLLGLTNESDDLAERIDTISLKEKFQECFVQTLATTAGIILAICFLLYPTSYGMFDVPKLYLELQSGEIFEAVIYDENAELNTIKLNEKSKVKLLTEGGKVHNYVLYNKVDLNSLKNISDISNLLENEISYFEKGEYIYKFTILYGKNKSVDYAIKVIVE